MPRRRMCKIRVSMKRGMKKTINNKIIMWIPMTKTNNDKLATMRHNKMSTKFHTTSVNSSKHNRQPTIYHSKLLSKNKQIHRNYSNKFSA